MTRIQRVRLALATLIMPSDYVPVPVAEINRVDELCAELQRYVPVSGGLNDPRRIKARHHIGGLTDALAATVAGLKEEE